MVHNLQDLQIGALSGRVAKITTKGGVFGRKDFRFEGSIAKKMYPKPARYELCLSARPPNWCGPAK
jgi:hypothetical protein